jgi:hypothetical protein
VRHDQAATAMAARPLTLLRHQRLGSNHALASAAAPTTVGSYDPTLGSPSQSRSGLDYAEQLTERFLV